MNTEIKYEIQYYSSSNDAWYAWPEWQTATDEEVFIERLKELRFLFTHEFRLVKKEIKVEILDA